MSLAERLRHETRALHTQAERSGVMRQLLRGTMNRPQYARLLRNLHAIYAALEPALRAHAEDPFIEPIHDPRLHRCAAIEADLRFLAGEHWRTSIPLASAALEYVARLEQASPAQLLAQAYVRYLGDLSGGQILQGIVRKALLLDGDDGTRFYRFEADAKILARGFRAGLDAIQVSEEEADQIVSEAQWAFSMHARLFEELASEAA